MKSSNPTKEEVRAWLKNELARRRPPPELKEIRQKLGWHTVKIEQDMPSTP